MNYFKNIWTLKIKMFISVNEMVSPLHLHKTASSEHPTISEYATPNVTKYQRGNFIIQIHQFTIKIDKINTNLLFECVKIVEFNFNSHMFHVMYQETRFQIKMHVF